MLYPLSSSMTKFYLLLLLEGLTKEFNAIKILKNDFESYDKSYVKTKQKFNLPNKNLIK